MLGRIGLNWIGRLKVLNVVAMNQERVAAVSSL